LALKATQQIRPIGSKSHPAESIWPQSSDNPKHGKQTVTTTIKTTTQYYYVEIIISLIEASHYYLVE